MASEIETNRERRGYIAKEVGFSSPRGDVFRKDHLNSILWYLGGEYVETYLTYGKDSPSKEWFYSEVAEEADIDYSPGEGSDARPFNSEELDSLIDAIEDAPL